jgi:hypothetical protein
MENEYFSTFQLASNLFPWRDAVAVYMNGKRVWPDVADGAWPDNADFPVGYDERDARL